MASDNGCSCWICQEVRRGGCPDERYCRTCRDSWATYRKHEHERKNMAKTKKPIGPPVLLDERFPTLRIKKSADVEIDPARLVSEVLPSGEPASINMVQRRNAGDFTGKAFYLDMDYEWVLGYDTTGWPESLILVPLKRV